MLYRVWGMEQIDLDVLCVLADQLSDEERRAGARVIKNAIAEIERLRASQFRWIPVGERCPIAEDGGRCGLVLTVDESALRLRPASAMIEYKGMTHWAPIPPLPEKPQEDRDEELWFAYSHSPAGGGFTRDAKAAFKAGLKAARSQQP